MKKLRHAFLFFLLLFQVNAAGAFTHDSSLIKWHAYSQETFELAKKEGKPIFMVIAAEWCYACKLYEEKTLETKEVSELLNEDFIAVFVDFDRDGEAVNKYLVRGTPTTILLSPEGEKITAVLGYVSKETLLANLEKALPHIRASESFEFFTYKKLNSSAIKYQNITGNSSSETEKAAQPLFKRAVVAAVLILALGIIAYKLYDSYFLRRS